MKTKVSAVIISAPSGGGKGTAIELFLNTGKFALSVSCTTRQRLPAEQDGKDYHFLSPAEFVEKIKNEEFLEYKEVYPNQFYGTLKTELEKAKGCGKILLLDIDVNGGEEVKKELGEQSHWIFIDSGDLIQTYKNRLHERGRGECQKDVQKRLARIPYELLKGRECSDKVIHNTDTKEEFIRELNTKVLVRF